MTSIPDERSPALVEQLLDRPTPDSRLALLRAENLLNADGLDLLLDFADGCGRAIPARRKVRRTVRERGASLRSEARGPFGLHTPADPLRERRVRRGVAHGQGRLRRVPRLRQEPGGAAHPGRPDVRVARTGALPGGARRRSGRSGRPRRRRRTRRNADAAAGRPADRARAPESRRLLRVHGPLRRGARSLRRRGGGLPVLDETERLGEILDNRGAVMLSLGRGNEALAAHEAAAAVFAEAELTLSHAKALCNIGEANRQLANYRPSLAAFEQARRLYGSLDARADKSLLMLDTANAYLDLNLYPEALAAYQKADALLRDAGMVHDRARALWGMGVALIARSELGEAEETLAEAAELFAAADNAPLLSSVMLEQSVLQETCGDPEAAVATASRALDLVLHTEWSVQSVYAHLRLADLLLPDTVEAEQHLLAARRLVEQLALPHLRYRLNERLGRLRRLQSSTEEARVLLEAAINQIERLRGTVAHETMRASFLADKTAAYAELLELHLAADHARQAFIVAERAKSRALVDLVTGVAKGPASSESEASEERIRTLQSDLNATYNLLLSGTDEGELVGPLPDLHRRAVDLEGEISQLRLRAAGSASDPFASFTPSDVCDDLPSDVALVAYHILGDEIVAFVGAKDGIRAVRDCGSASTVARLLQQLEVQWDRLEAGREFVMRHVALLERFAQQVLASLYRELVAPLEPLLRERADPHLARGRSKSPSCPTTCCTRCRSTACTMGPHTCSSGSRSPTPPARRSTPSARNKPRGDRTKPWCWAWRTPRYRPWRTRPRSWPGTFPTPRC